MVTIDKDSEGEAIGLSNINRTGHGANNGTAQFSGYPNSSDDEERPSRSQQPNASGPAAQDPDSSSSSLSGVDIAEYVPRAEHQNNCKRKNERSTWARGQRKRRGRSRRNKNNRGLTWSKLLAYMMACINNMNPVLMKKIVPILSAFVCAAVIMILAYILFELFLGGLITEESNESFGSNCTDMSIVHLLGEETPDCESAVLLYGHDSVCALDELQTLCCDTCSKYATPYVSTSSNGNEETHGFSNSTIQPSTQQGCIDQEIVVHNGQNTTCLDVLKFYGWYGLCVDSSLEDACCKTCRFI